MPLHVDIVTKPPRRTVELPPCLVPGCRVLADFRRSGLLGRIGAFHLNRRSGAFDVRSLFAFATVFFLAGPRGGLQAFCRAFGQALRRIARLADLPKLPSAGALSRALGATDRTTAEQVSDALLVADLGLMDVLGHPSMHHRDSQGNPWHVIDFDPTITAFRLRDLPSGEDLGPPVRRSPGVPGYTGHKRGETRIRHLPLMHAGGGFWLAFRLEEPGCSGIRSLQGLLTAARPWWARLEASGQVVLRFDGEFGHAGGFRVCRDAGRLAIGRLSRYTLLERPEIQAAMEAATWWEVPSSDAAKPTEAADLGWVTLHPADGATDAEEGPVEVRLVLSRLLPTEGRLRHGILVGPYQVEMFGTTLPPDAWPADEVVALYRGRAVLENRFAQEDREFATERTFSYHLWGQMRMVAIAMALWNHLICRAFQADPPLPPSPCRVPRPVEPAVTGPPLVIPSAATPVPAEPSALQAPQAEPSPPDPPPPGDPGAKTSTSDAPDRATLLPPPLLASIVEKHFHDVLSQPGWAFEPTDGTLTCPHHTTFRLTYTDQIKARGASQAHGHHRIILANPTGACTGCPMRADCFGSPRTNTAKRIARTVTADVASLVADALAARRRPVAPRHAPRRIDRANPKDPPGLCLLRPLSEPPPGPWRASTPSFLPAVARKRALVALQGAATLSIQRGPPPARPHPLLEEDRAVRQHQRRSRRRPRENVRVTLRVVVALHPTTHRHWTCD